MSYNEIILSFVTTIFAFIGIVFTVLQFKLAKKKRKDDLFNLRYEFYNDLSKSWIKTSNKNNPPWGIVDLIPVAEKAYFLFGKDIETHVLSLENKRASHDMFPDDDFSAPFRKYLKL